MLIFHFELELFMSLIHREVGARFVVESRQHDLGRLSLFARGFSAWILAAAILTMRYCLLSTSSSRYAGRSYRKVSYSIPPPTIIIAVR